MKLTYVVQSDCLYKTVRDVLKKEFLISSRLLTLLRKGKKVLLNGSNIYLDKELSLEDFVTVDLDFEEDNSNIVPYDFKLNIIYEDEAYLIIDKPARYCYTPILFTL